MVVVDSRDRRDGDYIESLGFYNPIPAAYELSLDSPLRHPIEMHRTVEELVRLIVD